MSIVEDQIRRLDSLLDRFQITAASLSNATAGTADSSRASRLRGIARSLSSTSNSRPLVTRQKLRGLLVAAKRQTLELSASSEIEAETDLEWMVAGKATVQVYGIILNTLLQQTIPLSDEIWYWDDVLGSYFRTALYTAQTAPLRFWKQTKEIYADAKRRYNSNSGVEESSRQPGQTLSEGWREFYGLVQNSVQDRSLLQARNRILSPFALARAEARKKQVGMRRLRETSATAIGLLIDEGLTFRSFDEEDKEQGGEDEDTEQGQKEWRNIVAKSISLLENILRNVGVQDHSISDFEESVFANIEEEDVSTNESGVNSSKPLLLTQKLVGILDHHLPQQERVSTNLAREYGRPSRLVQYWIPATILLLSGSTVFRIVANRRAEIRQWIQELGVTLIDFWSNWVIDPMKKLIGTVRHDESSEIAIMSRDSLKADKASLERMVIDFAVDHPEQRGMKYSDSQIADIRAKVNEGDLTPVLRAYEHDLKSPFMGAVTGDLVRALLIQIQKTKVDVEVAIGGIDSLLKSQELLFGIIGITPGVLISIAVFRWLGGLFGNRKGLKRGELRGDTVRLLRNVDRTLCTSTPTGNGMLSYKDHGLLLCEVSVLRERASNLLPGNIQRDFVEDIGDLLDIRNGIERQMKIVDRIQWAYAKWLR